jgi:putative ABC transport system permease protein
MFRQARRNKIVSGINLVGLVLAISACLLISQFVLFEHSFEDFHPNADRTYRINLYNTQNGLYTGTSAATVPALGYTIRQSIPGVENITRVSSRFRGVVSNPNRKFEDREDNIVFADPSVADVLSLELIDGTKSGLLHDPKSILISESTAKKYFGEINTVGRILEFGFSNNSLESTPFQIQGVFKDTPLNTHQRFDIVLPPDEKGWSENWAWSDVMTYVVPLTGCSSFIAG